jgi:hypothetical protein
MSGETYKLTCWQCSREIEVPAGAPDMEGESNGD